MGEKPENVARLRDVKLSFSGVIDIRTDSMRFNCILPDNKTNPLRKDRVTAVSDGALILKTNKRGRAGRLHWNKQGAVLAFEVKSPSLSFLITGQENQSIMGNSSSRRLTEYWDCQSKCQSSTNVRGNAWYRLSLRILRLRRSKSTSLDFYF